VFGRPAGPGRVKARVAECGVVYYYSRMIEEITIEILDPEVYLLSIYAKERSIGYDCRGSEGSEKVRRGFEKCKEASEEIGARLRGSAALGKTSFAG